jgi:TolB-like protein/tetratricopeptide (TPR) repeat protein
VDAALPGETFRLGDWLVEPSLNRVVREAQVRHLRPRLMDLLVYLADHPNQVVTKDQILDDVWGGRFVAESVLSRSIADLRQLLDDDAQEPRVIETISKRGYRLVAGVTRSGAGSAVGPRERDGRPSLVVLPFLDLAPARDHEYFCDGLAEELTNRLAHLHGLRVVARTSAFAFKGQTVDVREIGRRLGVRAALEGSVQRGGDRIRVTAQLIDVSDGCHVWSGRFDRTSDDIFAIEDEIARTVVSELRVALLGGTGGRVMLRPTKIPAAHDLYLRGRHHTARRTLEDLERAIGCFERAIELDPTYAAAHAGIAECCCHLGFVGFRRPVEVFPRARQEAERALEIDPGLTGAHAVLAYETAMHEWDWESAERHFLQALDLSPDHAFTRVWYSHLLTSSGRFDEALAQLERACECDPLAPVVRTTLGISLFYARQFDRAVDCCRQVLLMDPSFVLARYFIGRAYRAQGDFEAAVEELKAPSRVWPHALGCLAGSLRSLGRETEAVRVCDELERLSRRHYISPLVFAASAHISDYDTRLRAIARAFDEREGTVPLLNVDPMVDDLRSNPQFSSLIARLGLPDGARVVKPS